MMRTITILFACLAVASAAPGAQRIVGGSVATINEYPFASTLLRSTTGITYIQTCAGTIINSRTILTAARCVYGDSFIQWRCRVGSALANSGGTVLNTARIIVHPLHHPRTLDYDFALLHTNTISFGSTVAAASIAGANYVVPDNAAVWAIGWGATDLSSVWGQSSEQLRQVQLWTINQATCRQRNGETSVTDRMICSGWLDNGGRGQCFGDFGGPLLHNNAVVGVFSWSYGCGSATLPSVSARVSSAADWIVSNA